MTTWHRWCVVGVVVWMLGCSANAPGTEVAARKYFGAEFNKWMAGEENTVSTMRSRTRLLQEPIGYDIRSVVADKPDFLACQDTAKLPEDWRTWPAFKFNVAIEWKSEAETPLTKVTAYTLTWNTTEKRWYVTELH